MFIAKNHAPSCRFPQNWFAVLSNTEHVIYFQVSAGPGWLAEQCWNYDSAGRCWSSGSANNGCFYAAVPLQICNELEWTLYNETGEKCVVQKWRRRKIKFIKHRASWNHHVSYVTTMFSRRFGSSGTSHFVNCRKILCEWFHVLHRALAMSFVYNFLRYYYANSLAVKVAYLVT